MYEEKSMLESYKLVHMSVFFFGLYDNYDINKSRQY